MQPKNWVMCHAMPARVLCWATNVVLMDCQNVSQSIEMIESTRRLRHKNARQGTSEGTSLTLIESQPRWTTRGAHPFMAESQGYGARGGARGQKKR